MYSKTEVLVKQPDTRTDDGLISKNQAWFLTRKQSNLAGLRGRKRVCLGGMRHALSCAPPVCCRVAPHKLMTELEHVLVPALHDVCCRMGAKLGGREASGVRMWRVLQEGRVSSGGVGGHWGQAAHTRALPQPAQAVRPIITSTCRISPLVLELWQATSTSRDIAYEQHAHCEVLLPRKNCSSFAISSVRPHSASARRAARVYISIELIVAGLTQSWHLTQLHVPEFVTCTAPLAHGGMCEPGTTGKHH